MKKRRLLCLCLALMMILTLCGCGSVYKSTASDSIVNGSTVMENASAEYGTLEGDTLITGAVADNRKWIITVDMCAETEDLDGFLGELMDRIESLEGYVESSSVYNGSAYSSSRRYRNANLTIRIPAQRVDDFAQQVGEYANVTSHNRDMEDITLTYVSVESRMKALQTEEVRLLELMEQAETMADLLEIEARLTEVRYQLESVTSQLRVYDDQVDYATIYLYVSEVTEYTVVKEQTVWQRIGSGFVSSLKSIGNFCVEVFVFLLANVPYLAIGAAVIWGIVFLCRRSARKRRARMQPPMPPCVPPRPEDRK